MNNTSISFIIPAFNCADTIQESVDSIYEGNFEPGDEVIIVDDASTDGTSALLKKIQEKHPSTILLRHNINKGTAAASRNTAIDASKNNLLFTLDSDNVLIPGSIARLKEKMVTSRSDVAVFKEIWFFKGSTSNVTQKWSFDEEIHAQDCLAGRTTPCPTGNYLFTKSSWVKAGKYFEPTIINQTLDSWTFGVRQLLTGSKMVSLADSYYLHRTGINSHWVRENKKGNVSFAALIAIMPFLDRIEEEDVEYIFSKQARLSWFDSLVSRPLHLRSETNRVQSVSGVTKLEKNSKMLYKIKSLIWRLLK